MKIEITCPKCGEVVFNDDAIDEAVVKLDLPHCRTCDYDAKVMAERFQNFCNQYGIPTEEFVKTFLNGAHRTIYQASGNVLLEMIYQMSEDHRHGRYDGRNEKMCEVAEKLRETLDRIGQTRADGGVYRLPMI